MKRIFALVLAWLLVGCSHVASGPVVGVMLMYDNGELVGATVLGKAASMEACRKTAAEVLKQPHDPNAIKVACAALEVQ